EVGVMAQDKGLHAMNVVRVYRPHAIRVAPPENHRAGFLYVFAHDATATDPLSRRRLRPDLSRLLRDDRAPPHHAAWREHLRCVGHHQLPDPPAANPSTRLSRLGAR